MIANFLKSLTLLFTLFTVGRAGSVSPTWSSSALFKAGKCQET